jgi:hypothetical protein
MSIKRWPPPGFPLVEGGYALTAEWSIQLTEPFARRVEDGSLVLWRPGLTIWLAAWGNDRGQSRAGRLAWVKEGASPHRFAERESEADGTTRYSYRLRDENEDGPVESVCGYIFSEDGHLQLAVYYYDPNYEDEARRIVDSVERRGRVKPSAAADPAGGRA